MTNKKAIGVIKFEIACVNRQDTPRCKRDCANCDLCLPTEDVLEAFTCAIRALEKIEEIKEEEAKKSFITQEYLSQPEPYTEKKITNFYTKRFNEVN